MNIRLLSEYGDSPWVSSYEESSVKLTVQGDAFTLFEYDHADKAQE